MYTYQFFLFANLTYGIDGLGRRPSRGVRQSCDTFTTGGWYFLWHGERKYGSRQVDQNGGIVTATSIFNEGFVVD